MTALVSTSRHPLLLFDVIDFAGEREGKKEKSQREREKVQCFFCDFPLILVDNEDGGNAHVYTTLRVIQTAHAHTSRTGSMVASRIL